MKEVAKKAVELFVGLRLARDLTVSIPEIYSGTDILETERDLVSGFFSDIPPREQTTKYLDMILKHKALLAGHFEQLDGRHTALHLKFSRVGAVRDCAMKLAEDFHGLLKVQPQGVLGPISAGGLLVNPLAEKFDARAGYFDIDSQGFPDGVRVGYEIKEDEKVLLTNDIYTVDDKSILRMINSVNSCGGKVAGIAVFATQGSSAMQNLDELSKTYNIPAAALLHFEPPSFDKNSCYMCKEGSKPRTLASLALNS